MAMGTVSGGSYTICKGGPNPGAMPPRCIVEVDFGNAALTLSGGPQKFGVAGTIPIRIADLPFSFTIFAGSFSTDAAVDKGGTCPPATQPFISLAVQANVTLTGTGDVTVGCSPLTVTSLTFTQGDVANATGLCGGNIPSVYVSQVKTLVAQAVTPAIEDAVKKGIEGQACFH